MVDVKALRREKGLTGEVVSREVGISPSALSMIESGKQRPSVGLAKRLADFMGFDWTLFYDEDNQPPATVNALPSLPSAQTAGEGVAL